jgi:hypothetical protein
MSSDADFASVPTWQGVPVDDEEAPADAAERP